MSDLLTMRAVLDRPAPTATVDAVDARVARLEATVAALVHRVSQLERRRSPEADARLLAVVVTCIGPGVVFGSAQLWAHQRVSPELSGALDDATLTNARRLGKRLRGLQGRVLRGMTLDRVGANNEGALWTVRVAADSHPHA